MTPTPSTASHAVHADAQTLTLPEPAPKATSLDGQLESAVTIWEAADGSARAGVWECTPGEFTTARDGYGDVAQILSGRATVVGEDGVQVEVGPGSVLALPEGWRGRWIVHETIRKTYVNVYRTVA
jgi:uncharacterized cupin superfamily protein